MGSFTVTQTPSVTSSTSGATIIYTTDGSTPGTPSGCTPSGTGIAIANGATIRIASSMTVKAIGCLSGDVNSNVATAVFTILSATPIANPGIILSENRGLQ